MKTLELLAPARDLTSAIAAVDYGADALYIGGHGFGARRAASNSVEDIARAVEYAHPYGVRVYATLNTVIFDHELQQARRIAEELASAGVDALIVQDMAIARMGLPVELHASTQMCNMTSEGVVFLRELGFSRVVLERALSREQILEIAQSTDVEIEAFVHGAICVGHSGRCLLSRSMSNRSGNRGECSQPCRLSYDLFSDKGEQIISEKHLLSVKDLNLSHRLGEMIDIGVSSFKIEGRLKDIGYTKNIVAYYRQELDRAISEREGYTRSSHGVSHIDFTPTPSKSFSRGESEYLFSGQSRDLASFDTPKSMGESIGRVVDIRRDGAFRVDGDAMMSAGDGVCFLSKQGLRGTNINSREGEWLRANRTEGIERGVEIFRNFDKQFFDSLERSRTRRRIPLRAQISISQSIVTLKYWDGYGFDATTSLEYQAQETSNTQKMREVITTQLSKCGDTIFSVESVDVLDSGERYFLPSSVLASMRRECLTKLHNARLRAIPQGGRHFRERAEARYPHSRITPLEAVTNHLSEELYRDHGVVSIAKSWECEQNLEGARLLSSSYCLRYEIGECLKQGSKLRGDLYLHHGAHRYRLEFDCEKCRMSIYKS